MNILVTGCAGFIGFHSSLKILKNMNCKIYGIDNLNDYYDINLKKERLKILKKNKNFFFLKKDLKNLIFLENLFKKNKFDYVLHFAAQAGVRFSKNNTKKYFNSNIISFYNILELSKKYKIKHFIFSSSSSVYNNISEKPSKENDIENKPTSFYAATKLSNETFAYSYSNMYGLPCTGLRFFSVYGPWGRPDMSLFIFLKAIFNKEKVILNNKGNNQRDYTYIDDVIEIIFKLLKKPSKQNIPYNIFNIGAQKKIKIKYLINLLEIKTNKKLIKPSIGHSKLDVKNTLSNSSKINKYIKIRKFTNLDQGLNLFIDWFKDYYKINKK